jgi:mRNA interferase RelE/StbE
VKVEFRDSFAKNLRGLKAKGLLGKVREVVEAAEKAYSLAELANLKKLKGGGNYFRVRVGDYRVGMPLRTRPSSLFGSSTAKISTNTSHDSRRNLTTACLRLPTRRLSTTSIARGGG